MPGTIAGGRLGWLALAALAAVRTAAEAEVLLEILYGIQCPRCQDLLSHGVTELVRALLPGDRVQVTLLPMIVPPEGYPACMAEPKCRDALPPICALEPLLPAPFPADATKLPAVVDFLACDIVPAGSGLEMTPGTVPACAAHAGLPAADLQRCATDKAVFDLLFTEKYAATIMAALRRLEAAGFPDHVATPIVFLNGDLLNCVGDGCTDRLLPDGSLEPLEDPGSLLHLVCEKLDPKPKQCEGVQGFQGVPQVADLRACESCVETLGSWRLRRQTLDWDGRGAALRAGALCLLPALASVAYLAWRVASRAMAPDVRRPRLTERDGAAE